MKKSSMSESSSDIMELEEGLTITPHAEVTKKPIYNPNHNNNINVACMIVETDVWLLGIFFSLSALFIFHNIVKNLISKIKAQSNFLSETAFDESVSVFYSQKANQCLEKKYFPQFLYFLYSKKKKNYFLYLFRYYSPKIREIWVKIYQNRVSILNSVHFFIY